MAERPARILTIAGSDSGGGAGIQADIKTITMLGGHAMTAITAITAQNSRGVDAVQVLGADLVIAQIDAVARDFGLDAIKIGMLGSPEIAEALADWLSSSPHRRDPRVRRNDEVPVIFDPVMIASSGAVLADEATIAAFKRLMACATLVTPNLPELGALGGEAAVLELAPALLIKGGHASGETVTDRLVTREGEIARWDDPRIESPHTHGTGCTLSSAVATLLGQGLALEQAVERARLFVRLALRDAPALVAVNGPMGHQNVRNDALAPGWNLNQITLGATDYASSVTFYRALGLVQIVDSPDNGYARFEAGNGATLSVHVGEAAGGAMAYLECADLDARVLALASEGFAIEQMPRDESWGWREARLCDPAGNVLCLYFGGENRRYPPWRIATE
ncbi:MAG: bifunctional hydroxymethylpyrimidine kinase/phosphomethylpyrimidine kinase [Blastomonas fulva]|uniref:bifunctional hydroxymethylpyrimidine kinase/phosphomethylpyrimidine kinase n=1 Tax=Blastomonas fulva TaxID=1550728 RepID=UPI0024E1D14B|nr:bifunctional hydroxymethylpyrimidine kinase/phosphomethylpyrimidine kinase [Blastomonas fulva]MDK2755996.1 bifunctional hydroxymethylpyrimidine kinase/phosphomethylpyrimidine kinase [Blastomonas fulva]